MAEAQRSVRPTVSPLPGGARVLIVEARFYEALAEELAAGALAELKRHKVQSDRFAVPGAFEIPGAIASAADSGRFDGFIALGCVIRGETSHYDLICNEVARGLMDLSLHGIPVAFGVLTVENEAQAKVRADRKQKNKGREAVDAVLRMIELSRHFSEEA